MKKHILLLVATILTSFVFVTGSSFVLAQSVTPTLIKPSVNSTPTATNITDTSATLNGNVTIIGSSALLEKGFRYGLTTSYGSTALVTPPGIAGSFSKSITGLDCGKTYNYQSYARNSAGTTYSNNQTFTTAACPPLPTVDAPTSSGITRYSVILQGKTLTGTATEVGFEYSKVSGGPYTKQTIATVPPVGTTYSATIENLEAGTVYYFRSYAKNAGGTTYSSELNFKTNVSPTKIEGYAWSSNIGWVNFDGIRVSADPGKVGNLEGYAWSPNIGWIKFHDLSNYPTNGSPGVPANINLETGEVKGWIRACAGTVGGETNQNGADCRSMTSRTDGWDGWIELVGNGHMLAKSKNNLGVKMANAQTTSYQGLRMNVATGDLTGMAWGGEVIGWLNFNGAVIQKAFSATCSGVDAGNNSINFTASATGGSGKYEYKWDNGAYSDNPIKNVAIGSSNSVTIDLSVKDVGDGTTVPVITNLTCSAIPSTRNITASCSINGADANKNITIPAGGSVTFNITQPNPASSVYKYKWFYDNSNFKETDDKELSLNHTYSTAGVMNTHVTVTDITNPLNPYNRDFSCGIVTVKQPGINLYIGPDGARANKTSFLVKKGEPFGLAWENTLPIYSAATRPDGYICESLVNNAPGNWGGEWVGDLDQSDNAPSLSTTEVGAYKLKVQCLSFTEVLPPKFSEVNLKVFTTSGSEI